MDVLITGSGGLIGSALVPALEAAGHAAIRLRRGSGAAGSRTWSPEGGTIDAAAFAGVGGVVHLAGEGIAEKKWTPEQKRRILESRTKGTDLLARTIAGLDEKPAVLVSASAIGYYGNRGDEKLTEDSPPGDDFLAGVCTQWEDATVPASEAGVRVVVVRTGIVLSPKGGVLKQLLLPFRLGIGGRTGSGRQYMSWITLVDEIRAILFALDHERISGPLNLTAPNPVTNKELTSTLATVLHRPSVLPTPLLPLKIRYGAELVENLLVNGQRVLPAGLAAAGFEFVYPDLEAGLRGILREE
ncbi:MAG: TIGR01777 family oxidoreductase [Acidimicrobiia bacterium]